MKNVIIVILTLLFGTAFFEVPAPNPPESVPRPRMEEGEFIPPRRPSAYTAMFSRVARAEEVPAALLESIAFVESKFNPKARSKERENGSRDLGMFQLHEYYLRWFARKYNGGRSFDPFDPEASAAIAARHLKALKGQFGTWRQAVLAFNCGASRLEADNVPYASYRYMAKVWGRTD